MTQHTDSPAPIQIAGERGVHGFGQASDMDAFAPAAHYTAIIDDWSAYYVARVKAVMDGTWESGDVWGGFDADMVVMATLHRPAGGRRGRRRRDGREDSLRRVPSLHRPRSTTRRASSASRKASGPTRACCSA